MNCKTARYSLSLEIDGRLDEKGQSKLREHLDGCRKCREYEATVRGIGRVLESLPKSTPMNGGWQRLQARMEKSEPSRTVFPRLLAPVGAAIIFFAVIAYVGFPRNPGTIQSPMVATNPNHTTGPQIAEGTGSGKAGVIIPDTNRKTTSIRKNTATNKTVIKLNKPEKSRMLRRPERFAQYEPQPVKHRLPGIRTRHLGNEVLASASEATGQGLSRDLDSLVDQGFTTLVEAGSAENTSGRGENL